MLKYLELRDKALALGLNLKFELVDDNIVISINLNSSNNEYKQLFWIDADYENMVTTVKNTVYAIHHLPTDNGLRNDMIKKYDKLYKLVIDFSATPIEKRFNKKRYIIPFGQDNHGYTRYWTHSEDGYQLVINDQENDAWQHSIDNQFDRKDIDKLKKSQNSIVMANAIEQMKKMI